MTTTKDTQYEEEVQKHVEAHIDAGNRSATQGELLFHTKVAQDGLAGKKKNKQISFRIAESDLIKLKALAIEEGMPYQTYLSTLIHQHTKGVL